MDTDSPPWLNAMQQRLEAKRDEALKRRRERLGTKDEPQIDVGQDGSNDDATSAPEPMADRADDLAEFRAFAQNPAEEASEEAGEELSEGLSEDPSEKPSEEPSEEPSEGPNEKPSEAPSEAPSEGPSERGTERRTERGTEQARK